MVKSKKKTRKRRIKMVAKKETLANADILIKDGWDKYERGNTPHFSDYKEWLQRCEELKNENINRFFMCEDCKGIYVNNRPFNDKCSCGNYDPDRYMILTGERRQDLKDGIEPEKFFCYSFC